MEYKNKKKWNQKLAILRGSEIGSIRFGEKIYGEWKWKLWLIKVMN